MSTAMTRQVANAHSTIHWRSLSRANTGVLVGRPSVMRSTVARPVGENIGRENDAASVTDGEVCELNRYDGECIQRIPRPPSTREGNLGVEIGGYPHGIPHVTFLESEAKRGGRMYRTWVVGAAGALTLVLAVVLMAFSAPT